MLFARTDLSCALRSRRHSRPWRGPFGHRRVVNLLGGTVAGTRLNGRILPGGSDWQILSADGSADIHARYTVESDAGALIQVDSKGLRHGPPDVLARLAHGETSIRRSIISAP